MRSRQSPGPRPGRLEARPRLERCGRSQIHAGAPQCGRGSRLQVAVGERLKAGRDHRRRVGARRGVSRDRRPDVGRIRHESSWWWPMPNFSSSLANKAPIFGRAPGALHALIGEKSQGDNPARTRVQPRPGRRCNLPAYARGLPLAAYGHWRIRCSRSRPELSASCLVRSYALLGKFHCLPESREVEKLGLPCISPDPTSPSP